MKKQHSKTSFKQKAFDDDGTKFEKDKEDDEKTKVNMEMKRQRTFYAFC